MKNFKTKFALYADNALKVISTILMFLLMCIALPLILSLFLVIILLAGIGWALGVPVQVTTRVKSTGRRAGGKITETYRWFTKL